jgi:hypothetical protein
MFDRFRATSPALVIALIALFVALGGAAYAVKLGKNDVKTRNIASKAVTGSKLATDAVKTAKLRDAAVSSPKLADGAVGSTALADGAVERKKIKAQAVTESKLADGAVTAQKLGAGSVTSAAVLAAVTQSVNPPPIGGATCDYTSVAVAAVQAGDSVVVTPSATLDTRVIVTADSSAGTIGLRFCNPTASAIDPPSTELRLLVIR